MKAAIEEMIETVLRPLVQADGGDVELVTAEHGKVVLRVSGEAAFGAGSQLVRTEVIEPAVRRVAKDAEIEWEMVVPKATHRSADDG